VGKNYVKITGDTGYS